MPHLKIKILCKSWRAADLQKFWEKINIWIKVSVGRYVPSLKEENWNKSLARPGRKKATAAEDFDVHVSNLLSYLEEY